MDLPCNNKQIIVFTLVPDKGGISAIFIHYCHGNIQKFKNEDNGDWTTVVVEELHHQLAHHCSYFNWAGHLLQLLQTPETHL